MRHLADWSRSAPTLRITREDRWQCSDVVGALTFSTKHQYLLRPERLPLAALGSNNWREVNSPSSLCHTDLPELRIAKGRPFAREHERRRYVWLNLHTCAVPDQTQTTVSHCKKRLTKTMKNHSSSPFTIGLATTLVLSRGWHPATTFLCSADSRLSRPGASYISRMRSRFSRKS